MGMDLVRRRDSIKWTCNNQLWIYLLNAAKSSGWEPLGVQHEDNDLIDNDPMDYYSNKSQTVSPADSKRLYQAILNHLNLKKPSGIEKDIAEDFLSWLARGDEGGAIIDIPGFIIR